MSNHKSTSVQSSSQVNKDATELGRLEDKINNELESGNETGAARDIAAGQKIIKRDPAALDRLEDNKV